MPPTCARSRSEENVSSFRSAENCIDTGLGGAVLTRPLPPARAVWAGRGPGSSYLERKTHDQTIWRRFVQPDEGRSEEHTSEIQSLMRSSYAVFCLQNKQIKNKTT